MNDKEEHITNEEVNIMLTPSSLTTPMKQHHGTRHERNKLYVGIEKTMSPLLMFANMEDEEGEDGGSMISSYNNENQSPVSVFETPMFIDQPLKELKNEDCPIQNKENEEEEESTSLYEIPVLFIENQDESTSALPHSTTSSSSSNQQHHHSHTDSLVSVKSAGGNLPAIPEDRPDFNTPVEDNAMNKQRNEHEEDVPLKDLLLSMPMMNPTTTTSNHTRPEEGVLLLSDKDSTLSPDQKAAEARPYQRKYFPSPRLLGMQQTQQQKKLLKEEGGGGVRQYHPERIRKDDGAAVIPPTTAKTTISSYATISSSIEQKVMTHNNNNDKNHNHHSLSSSPSTYYQHCHRRVRSLPTTRTAVMSTEISSPIVHQQIQKEKQILNAIQQYGNESHVEVVQLYSQLGTFYFHQTQYEQAADQYLKALSIIQTLQERSSKKIEGVKRLFNNHPHPSSSDTLTNLEAVVCTNYGTNLWHLHEFKLALTHFQCAYTIRKKYSGSLEHGNAAYHLGCAYYLLLKRMETKGENSNVGDDGMPHYITRNETKIVPKALKLVQEALMIQMKHYCHTKSKIVAANVARTMDLLSLFHEKLEQTEEATKWSHRSKQMKEECTGV